MIYISLCLVHIFYHLSLTLLDRYYTITIRNNMIRNLGVIFIGRFFECIITIFDSNCLQTVARDFVRVVVISLCPLLTNKPKLLIIINS